VGDFPPEEPGEGEVRLKVEAIGFNRAEVMHRQGPYLERPTLPSRIGYEASGTVYALGRGVDELAIGDLVSTIPSFSTQKDGGYGESAIVPPSLLPVFQEHSRSVEGDLDAVPDRVWRSYALRPAAKRRLRCDPCSEQQRWPRRHSDHQGRWCGGQCDDAVEKRPSLIDAGEDHVAVTNDEDLAGRVKAITFGKGARINLSPGRLSRLLPKPGKIVMTV
jgi:alcohol dehydrogenase-like protein